jgi:hypothetical protein
MAAYLVATQDRSLMDAYSFVKSKRAVCKIRPNFLKQLVQWEQGLAKKKAEEAARKSAKRKESGPSIKGPAGPPPRVVQGPAGPPKAQGPAVVRGPVGPQGPPKTVEPAAISAEDAKSAFFNRKRKKTFGSSMPGM